MHCSRKPPPPFKYVQIIWSSFKSKWVTLSGKIRKCGPTWKNIPLWMSSILESSHIGYLMPLPPLPFWNERRIKRLNIKKRKKNTETKKEERNQWLGGAGWEEGAWEVVRPGSCLWWRRLAAVLAKAWRGHPDWQQVITRQRATWTQSTVQQWSLLMHASVIGHHEIIQKVSFILWTKQDSCIIWWARLLGFKATLYTMFCTWCELN